MKPFVILAAFLLLAGAPWMGSAADPIPGDSLADMQAADAIILGEVHDNPQHHLVQTEAIKVIAPSAVVREMVTEDGLIDGDFHVVIDSPTVERENPCKAFEFRN